jgi:hypothetical protein
MAKMKPSLAAELVARGEDVHGGEEIEVVRDGDGGRS